MPPSSPSDDRNTQGLEHATLATCNAFCRRSLLEATGGFDPRFTKAYREDSDLEFTLREAGAHFVNNNAAIVVHPPRKESRFVSLRQQRNQLFDALLYRKHPRLFRESIRSIPPLSYYAIVIAQLASLLGAVRGNAGLTRNGCDGLGAAHSAVLPAPSVRHRWRCARSSRSAYDVCPDSSACGLLATQRGAVVQDILLVTNEGAVLTPLPNFSRSSAPGRSVQSALSDVSNPVSQRRSTARTTGLYADRSFQANSPSNTDVEHLHLQGLGEPLMHPRIFDMIEHTVERGIEVSTNTNLTLLTKSRAERCVRSGIAEIHVSIDGATPELTTAFVCARIWIACSSIWNG